VIFENSRAKFTANWFGKKYELFSDQKTPQMKQNKFATFVSRIWHEFGINLT